MSFVQKIIAGATAAFMSFFAAASSVFAQGAAMCTVNGKEVPCDQILNVAGGIAGGLGAIMIVIWVIALLCFVFWLWMFIHALSKPIENKVVWVIVLLFTGILGAIIYYFMVKRKM